ncbi:hypothetical protein C8Q72DRAFT_932650, partial [Fomitopsis betulina]
ELSPQIATPMVRIGMQDYYTYAPAKLADGRIVMPIRWFTKVGIDGRQTFHGEGWSMCPVVMEAGQRGYIVHEFDSIWFTAADLSLSFPTMVAMYAASNLPDPQTPLGLVQRLHGAGCGVHPWTHTNPAVGNPWRAWSNGHRVVSFMMWPYCDDTSGNMSKKWNKHNSWLSTPAGLPQEVGQQEGNIHFLATSNITPPLEMLDRIISQLE